MSVVFETEPNDDFAHAVTRLLSGERGYLFVDDLMQDDLKAELGPEVRAKLQPIIDRRRALAKIEEQLEGVAERRNKLDQRSGELRENLRAIAKNPKAAAQREKWTKQLDEFTSEANKLGAQLADLEAKRLDQRVELEDALQEFELVMPAPKTPPPPTP